MRWVPAGLFIVLTAAAGQSGCASPVRLGDDYGDSYGLIVESQLLHPEAEASTAPVTGLDGQAARRAVKAYQRSFDKSETESGAAGATPTAPGTSPLAGAPPSYSSAATGTMPSSPGQK